MEQSNAGKMLLSILEQRHSMPGRDLTDMELVRLLEHEVSPSPMPWEGFRLILRKLAVETPHAAGEKKNV